MCNKQELALSFVGVLKLGFGPIRQCTYTVKSMGPSKEKAGVSAVCMQSSRPDRARLLSASGKLNYFGTNVMTSRLAHVTHQARCLMITAPGTKPCTATPARHSTELLYLHTWSLWLSLVTSVHLPQRIKAWPRH